MCFPSKNEKKKEKKITFQFSILKLFWVQNFSFNKQSWFIGRNLLKKDASGQTCKNEDDHWILPI